MAAKKTADPADGQDAQAKIEKRAHEIYLERTKKNLPGDAQTDWLAAEKEIVKKKK
jgi:hypothetical protein